MLSEICTRIAAKVAEYWPLVTLPAILLLCAALGGCTPEEVPQNEQAWQPPPNHNVIDRAPAPETADDAVRLQNELDKARGELANVRDWAKAEIDAFRNKAATADAAVGVFGKVAFLAFLAVPVAWFLGGIRTAALVALFASAIAFAPTIIGGAWAAVEPIVLPAAAIVAVALMVYWGFRLWLDMRGRWLESHGEARAGVAMRATARGMTAENGPAKKWRKARLDEVTNGGLTA